MLSKHSGKLTLSYIFMEKKRDKNEQKEFTKNYLRKYEILQITAEHQLINN